MQSGLDGQPDRAAHRRAGGRPCGHRATVVGRVRQVRVQPRNGVATAEVTLADATGDVRVVFLGRRHIAGIVPGTLMSAHAVVGQRLGHVELLNPAYTLLLAD